MTTLLNDIKKKHQSPSVTVVETENLNQTSSLENGNNISENPLQVYTLEVEPSQKKIKIGANSNPFDRAKEDCNKILVTVL